MPDTAPVNAIPSGPIDPEAGAPAPQTGLGHFAGLIRSSIPPMHPGGRPIVAGVAGAALLARAVTGRGTLLGTLVTAGIAAFFREPARVTPMRAGIVVAPADGLVSTVGEALPPPELGLTGGPVTRVSVFLSVLDVHVQRIPLDARVERLVHRPGLFLSADLDKASDDNERNSMLLRGTEGHQLAVVQIAGLLARRIVCQVREGDEVAAGQTYGLIRFGSRVDTYLPPGSNVLVAPGQRTIGGETVIAELPPAPAPS
ncbi:MAG TPA: phosphatidylserine decarboxylase [Pseudonocardia sp.]|jgi:phosphatidylserine decarboxylase|nr:phosphatidylserine decarboxylase [Pseudonocardia sp.]